jgi:hypothetical protein
MKHTFLVSIWSEIKNSLKIYFYILLIALILTGLWVLLPEDTREQVFQWMNNAKPYLERWGSKMSQWINQTFPFVDEWRTVLMKTLVGMMVFYFYVVVGIIMSGIVTHIATGGREPTVRSNRIGLIVAAGIAGVGTYYSMDLPLIVWVLNLLK